MAIRICEHAEDQRTCLLIDEVSQSSRISTSFVVFGFLAVTGEVLDRLSQHAPLVRYDALDRWSRIETHRKSLKWND